MLKQMNPVAVIVGVVIALYLAGFAIYRQVAAPTETVNTTTMPAEEKTDQATAPGTGATPVTREQSPGMQP